VRIFDFGILRNEEKKWSSWCYCSFAAPFLLLSFPTLGSEIDGAIYRVILG
jgi:hypothetical protein